MSGATRRPWRVDGRFIRSDARKTCSIAEVPTYGIRQSLVDEENANLIVRAVNNFDALLDVAKAVVEQFPLAGISSSLGSHNPLEDLLARAEAAIVAAEASE